MAKTAQSDGTILTAAHYNEKISPWRDMDYDVIVTDGSVATEATPSHSNNATVTFSTATWTKQKEILTSGHTATSYVETQFTLDLISGENNAMGVLYVNGTATGGTLSTGITETQTDRFTIPQNATLQVYCQIDGGGPGTANVMDFRVFKRGITVYRFPTTLTSNDP